VPILSVNNTLISVVITTYNRAVVVPRAIRSAQNAFNELLKYEIVVVDDASTDNTVSLLNDIFAEDISNGRIRIVCNSHNRGVTGSKNAGYAAATGMWVIFLDSDDMFLNGIGNDIISTLNNYYNKPLVFFRCVDHRNNFIGDYFKDDIVLDLKTYLEFWSFGEALTAVNKGIVKQEPYCEFLRGYEGIGCCRIIMNYGSAVLSKTIARRYICANRNRLSVSTGFYRRMPLIAKGNLILLREFGTKMRWYKIVECALKAVVYGLFGKLYGLTARENLE